MVQNRRNSRLSWVRHLGVKKLLRELFLGQGIYVSRATSKDELESLLHLTCLWTPKESLTRVGSRFDGGYVIPDVVPGYTTCHSAGVGDNCDFEMALAASGTRCFLLDGTIDKLPIQTKYTQSQISFEKTNLDSFKSSSGTDMTHWLASTESTLEGKRLLKLDIEGSEYAVLWNVNSDQLAQFYCLVIEFHHVDAILLGPVKWIYADVMKKVTESHKLVHVHPNNCSKPIRYGDTYIPSVLEMTFVRNDGVLARAKSTHLPSPLDAPNLPDKEDFALHKSWYMTTPQAGNVQTTRGLS